MISEAVDTGTALRRKPRPTMPADRGRRGTPMGELLRRYWHPVGLRRRCQRHAAQGARAGRRPDPVPRRAGRPGLVYPRCAIAAPRSITARSRSAASAAAITAGCSTRRAIASSSRASRRRAAAASSVRQPWYPVEELYGLIFAYMGPPEQQAGAAALRMPRGARRGRVRRGRRLQHRRRRPAIIPCNWLQHYENVVDPFHVPVLHALVQRRAVRRADGA